MSRDANSTSASTVQKGLKYLRQSAVYLKYECSTPRDTGSGHGGDPILLDTGLLSWNAGDDIIMHYANKQLSRLFDLEHVRRIPVHGGRVDVGPDVQGRLKILCGTNALNTHMNRHHSIALPGHVNYYRNSVLLLAVGLADAAEGTGFNAPTRRILRNLLAGDHIHSVRDGHTEKALKDIGITNVLNTSCVTMWDLTEQFCASIPVKKHTDVLTSITDYNFDPTMDGYMLSNLQKHYRTVYLWVQGTQDEDRLRLLPDIEGIELIRGGLPGLREFVATHKDIDYFGTRLHCGIYCLNHRIRSRIVSIDNRAADIAKDTGLPIAMRADLKDSMDDFIEQETTFGIHIPDQAIHDWKMQFAAE